MRFDPVDGCGTNLGKHGAECEGTGKFPAIRIFADAFRGWVDYVHSMHLKLFIGGQWRDGAQTVEVTNKFTGETIATCAQAEERDVRDAIAAAEKAAPVMAALPAHKRATILL